MYLFLGGIMLLILGYFTYGRLLERIIGPDDRETPALKNADGVDYVVLPHWKNMLIQLLNIAGIGPVIGVILGIKFGTIVFLIIPLGNLIAGATHDFLGGMMSLRSNGANLPELIRENLGTQAYRIFSIFMTFLLLLVVAVFINIPANLLKSMASATSSSAFWLIVGAIFLYYIVATLFPVDKIIGMVYPFFGLMLLVGTLAIFIGLLISGVHTPELLTEGEEFHAFSQTYLEKNPVLPMLFVTIACGIISGFHATQSPIIARTMKSERQARSSFYGMMVVEGIIGMVWAGAGLAIYNLYPALLNGKPTVALMKITNEFIGGKMGMLTVLAVIILAVTSGDTAMRSLRLSLAEIFHLNQKKFLNRIILCIPLILVISALLLWSNRDTKSFDFLWNYFAWGNQILAACTLMAAAVWLLRQKKTGYIAIVPGIFMTFIVVTYICWTSPAHGGPVGMGLPLPFAYAVGVALAFAFGLYASIRGRSDTPELNSKSVISDAPQKKD